MPRETPLNGLGITAKLNLGLEKPEKSQGISYCLESGNPGISSSIKNKITEHYLDSKVISQQELRIRTCCTLSIDIVNVCFDRRYSTAVLQTEE